MATNGRDRTGDRYHRTRSAINDSKNKIQPNNTSTNSTRITWSMDDPATDEVFRELDVDELRWPEEDARDSSQDLKNKTKIVGTSVSSRIAFKRCSHGATINCNRGRDLKRACNHCSHTQPRQDQGTSERPDLFAQLADEVILGIFKLLPRDTLITCAQVCKHWLSLVYDESLWLTVDMSKAKLQHGLLGRILLRGTRVMRIASSRVCSPLLDENLGILPGVAPLSPSMAACNSLFRLTYLDATLCTFEDSTLLTLLLHSRRLRCLSLDSSNLSLSILRAIGDCHDLEVLNLAMCTGITLQGVKALVNGCKRLTHLNLAWTHLSKESIIQVVQNLPLLRQLNLSGSRETMTDEAVLHLISNCIHLTHLDLSDCILITARSLLAIIQETKIEHLALSRCYNIPPQAFSLCVELKSLAKLDVYGLLNGDGVEILKRQLPDTFINSCLFSTIARPVDSKYRGTIWGIRCQR